MSERNLQICRLKAELIVYEVDPIAAAVVDLLNDKPDRLHIGKAPLPTPTENPQADPYVPAVKRDAEQSIPDADTVGEQTGEVVDAISDGTNDAIEAVTGATDTAADAAQNAADRINPTSR
ncbi:hypothetical protein WR25_08155 [Diploscapter pachys]|uniref:Uncharacterized protein n=1 Tax=Diploscapter pachys TaxID=2018661 RepID=A0A2A2LSP7_9BILA|nr:hypothetical protein WR25_08155 [Diploscapter pachys]